MPSRFPLHPILVLQPSSTSVYRIDALVAQRLNVVYNLHYWLHSFFAFLLLLFRFGLLVFSTVSWLSRTVGILPGYPTAYTLRRFSFYRLGSKTMTRAALLLNRLILFLFSAYAIASHVALHKQPVYNVEFEPTCSWCENEICWGLWDASSSTLWLLRQLPWMT